MIKIKRLMLIIFRIIKKSMSIERKSRIFYLYCSIFWLIREHEFFYYFKLMDLSRQGKKIKDVLGKAEEFRILNKVENRMLKQKKISGIDYSTIVKDKHYLTSVLKGNSLSCVENVAFIDKGIVEINNESLSIEKYILLNQDTFIIKNTVLEYNEGFYQIEYKNNKHVVNNGDINLDDLLDILSKGNWVIQKKEHNCESIRRISSQALNTTRIVTIMSPSGPEYLAGFQSFATGDSYTDSWGKGAIYIGFNPTNGQLKKYGFQHPLISQKKIYMHPNSGVRFENCILREVTCAIELCIKAHKLLYNSFLIGWDVVLSDQGPKILEGNERPGMNAVQCVDRLLRRELKEYARKQTNKI